ncbi:hypothetical protein LXL04_030641 [Taraxacum kok-saghyz]
MFDTNEKESLLEEIKTLRTKLQSSPSINKSIDRVRSSSLLSQSLQLRKSGAYPKSETSEELENERERWMEMESEWIYLTDELRVDLEANRRRSENVEMELRLEKKCSEELDDALMRSILGHGKMVEHYADLQEIPTVAPVEVRRSRSDGRDGQRTTGYRDGEEGGRDVEGFLEVVGTLFITHRNSFYLQNCHRI